MDIAKGKLECERELMKQASDLASRLGLDADGTKALHSLVYLGNSMGHCIGWFEGYDAAKAGETRGVVTHVNEVGNEPKENPAGDSDAVDGIAAMRDALEAVLDCAKEGTLAIRESAFKKVLSALGHDCSISGSEDTPVERSSLKIIGREKHPLGRPADRGSG